MISLRNRAAPLVIGAIAFTIGLIASGGGLHTAHAQDQIQNGGFETGDLTDWTTTGNVEVLAGSNFAPAISSPEGGFFAFLSTGFVSSGNSGADRDSSGFNEHDIATLTQTFDLTVGTQLSFTVAFVTDEVTLPSPANEDDIFEVVVDGTPVIQGSVPGVSGTGAFPDFGVLDGVSYTVTSPGPTNGSSFFDGITATVSVGGIPLGPGSHSIEFFIGDEQDNAFDSGLVVDDVILGPFITLDPSTATNTVDKDHPVTATVTDGLGDPFTGGDVEIIVTEGPNSGDNNGPGGTALDASGQAAFTYTGDGGTGTDTIQACLVDFQEVCTTATKTWVAAPTSTPTPTPTATSTPQPTPEALPDTGGTPSDGGSGALPWLATMVGALALMGAGSGLWLYQRRRIR